MTGQHGIATAAVELNSTMRLQDRTEALTGRIRAPLNEASSARPQLGIGLKPTAVSIKRKNGPVLDRGGPCREDPRSAALASVRMVAHILNLSRTHTVG